MKVVFNPIAGTFDFVGDTSVSVSYPLAASLGGTGVANGASATLTLPNFPITIAGGVTGGTYTLPSTAGGGTVALLNTANVFTAIQKINVNSTTAFLVEQDGVKDNTLIVDTTNGALLVNTDQQTYRDTDTGGDNFVRYMISSPAAGENDKFQGVAMGSASQGWIFVQNNQAGNRIRYASFNAKMTQVYTGIEKGIMQFYTKPSTGGVAERLRLDDTGDVTILGDVGIGLPFGTDPSAHLHVVDNTSATATIRDVLRLETQSTGTAAAGLGAGLLFSLETATASTIQNAGRVYSEWVVATNASRTAKTSITAYDSAGERIGLTVAANGSVSINTFSGGVVLAAGTTAASTAPLKFTTGTALTTPEAGTLEYHNDRIHITNVATRRVIDRTSDVITSTTTVTNTVTETTIYTGSVVANEFKVGNLIKVRANGVLTNATAADDITFKVYIGSTLVETFAPAIGNVTGASWDSKFEITVRSVGASGSLSFYGETRIDSSTEQENSIQTIDTTVAEDLTVKVQWANAKAGNTISIYQGYMEIKN